MQNKTLKNLADWRYNILIILLICGAFSPYIFYTDWGFHNDFTIWEYNNKVCCSGFPEDSHLINIGRFLQAYLQGFYLSFFTDLRSLVFGRALGIAFACIGAIMISLIARKNGLGKLSSAAFGAAVFLLPPAQVNLAWITNFVPGLFNAVLVLGATFIFPEWHAVSNQNKSARLKLGISFLILLATLFIYPPTIGFFLLPTMMRIMRYEFTKREERLQAAYSLIFTAIVCLTYFFLHRVIFMKLLGITFPEHSFYRFDIAHDLWGNIRMFFVGVVPVMLNLWNPAPFAGFALSVLLLIAAPAALAAYRDCKTSAPRKVFTNYGILAIFLLALFCAMNVPGLLAIGRPPAFYRAWHPGTAAVLFLLFHSIESFSQAAIKRIFILVFLLLGCFFSYNSSTYLATILTNQFKYSLAQISAQFSPTRERYVIVDKRPETLLFGHPRWGELGFVHILPRGHGIYILSKYFDYHVYPILENIVAKQDENPLILESELLEKSSSLYPRSPAEAINKPFDAIFDSRADTYFETPAAAPATIDIIGTRPDKIACYKIYAGVDTPPSQAPRSWRLSGSNDDLTWDSLDSKSNQSSWAQGESRVFTPREMGAYKHYRFEIDPAGQNQPAQIAEMQLFTRANSCQQPNLPQATAVNPNLIKSLTSTNDSMPVSLAGVATESSLSDPPFRLQRALDNIYYTFWETRGPFPIKVNFRFFQKRKIQCYAFQAGDDRANDRMPKSWRLLGSNDGVTWNTVDSRIDEPAWIEKEGLGDMNNNARRDYLVANPNDYLFYKLEFLSVYNREKIFRLYDMAFSEDRDCLHTMP